MFTFSFRCLKRVFSKCSLSLQNVLHFIGKQQHPFSCWNPKCRSYFCFQSLTCWPMSIQSVLKHRWLQFSLDCPNLISSPTSISLLGVTLPVFWPASGIACQASLPSPQAVHNHFPDSSWCSSKTWRTVSCCSPIALCCAQNQIRPL